MSRHSQSSCLEELERLQQTLTAQQRQLNDLVAEQQRLLRVQQAQPKPLEMWKPEFVADYFVIDANGTAARRVNANPSATELSTVQGNCFPTRELAEYYAKRRAARQRLEMLALAENGMVPYEFDRTTTENYRIQRGCTELYISSHQDYQSADPYFSTEAAAQRVLSAMSEDDLILLYGTANRGDKDE
jgi:hypothetical protein